MNEKNKKLIDEQIQLIDKQIKAVPRTLTNDQIQILLLEREKLVASKNAVIAEGKTAAADSGPTIGTGLKAMGAAAAFGGGRELDAAAALTLFITGKKMLGGLFKKKNDKAPTENEESEKREEGAPEKTSTSKEGSSDNKAIISILNKILKSFESDNERMRRSIKGAAEAKLESDPTPDTPGGPVREGDDKKSGMNKLLMFGAIAGLLGLAYKFRDEIAETLKPITDMLGITNPLKDAEKEDYDFDIMDILGVAGLLGMLGLPLPGSKSPSGTKPSPGTKPPPGPGAPEKTSSRPRHPAGAKNAAGKSIGGQFMKVSAEDVKGVIKQSILKRVGGAIGKVVPGLGLAFGLYDAFQRASKGDLVGAGVALGGGVVGLAPGLGTGASVALMAANIARDVYNDAYGVFPEQDESGEVLKRAEDILKQVVESLGPSKPLSEQSKKALEEALAQFAAATNPTMRQGAAMRVRRAAQALGISSEKIEEELGILRAGGPKKTEDPDTQKLLQELQKSNAAVNTENAAAAPHKGAAPAVNELLEAAASGRRIFEDEPAGGGAPTGGGATGGAPAGGAPVAAPPAPSTPGTAITTATMDASEAENTVTVLPPIVNNETNNMRTGNENRSKAQKVKMQVRLQDETFRSAIEATAAVINLRKTA